MNTGKAIGNFFLLYIAVCFFFSFYSVLLDQIFFQIDHGESEGLVPSFFTYIIYFVVVCFPIALPVIFLYNWVAAKTFVDIDFTKLFLSLFVGIAVGVAIKRGGYSFYIGEMRALKNIILWALTFLSSEFVRVMISKQRSKNEIHKEKIS